MKYPFDANGTIGKKPCEISLNHILAELDNLSLRKSILKIILFAKDGLVSIKNIEDKKYINFFVRKLREDCERRISEVTGVQVRGAQCKDVVASHTMCCVAAYCKEFVRNKISGGQNEVSLL